mmetsp:Transcript_72909/g.202310  ORF Transcript_72909/g.202310 Transcript_72909/m.202310 type:complete len:294 (+) Transcript_72909:1317-2198(+)
MPDPISRALAPSPPARPRGLIVRRPVDAEALEERIRTGGDDCRLTLEALRTGGTGATELPTVVGDDDSRCKVEPTQTDRADWTMAPTLTVGELALGTSPSGGANGTTRFATNGDGLRASRCGGSTGPCSPPPGQPTPNEGTLELHSSGAHAGGVKALIALGGFTASEVAGRAVIGRQAVGETTSPLADHDGVRSGLLKASLRAAGRPGSHEVDLLTTATVGFGIEYQRAAGPGLTGLDRAAGGGDSDNRRAETTPGVGTGDTPRKTLPPIPTCGRDLSTEAGRLGAPSTPHRS